MTPPTISFITVNYRSRDALRVCLSSLIPQLRKEHISFEWLIANNSPEESLDEIKQSFDIILAYEGKNIGFGTAINIVAQKAQGKFLWLINPDTIFLNGSVSNALEIAQNNSPALLGFPLKDRNGNENIYDFGSDLTLFSWIIRKLLPKRFFLPNQEKPTPMHWVSGASLFIPQEIFQKIDGFDEQFFLYFEDRDLCLRARKHAKARCLYTPVIFFQHQSGTSFEGNIDSQKNYYYTSLLQYAKKHLSLGEQFFFKTLIQWKQKDS